MRRAISLGAIQPEPQSYVTADDVAGYLTAIHAADAFRAAFEQAALSSTAAIPAFRALVMAMQKAEDDLIVYGKVNDGH
jgi:hypothetical protein